MTIPYRVSALTGAAAAAFLAAAPLQAATIFWQGGNGTLVDANYSDGTLNNLAPTAADVVNFGAGGTATYSTPGPLALQKLRVGHNQAPGGTGTGEVTISNGAAVALTDGASGALNASLWVGNVQNGTLNIDGPTTSLTAARLIVVGYGNNVNRTATVNITNGGSLIATLGNIILGEGTGGNPNGVQGHVFVDGTVTTLDGGADLIIGARQATSTFTQTGGLVSIGDAVEVGADDSTGSTYSISGGVTTHGGNFFVGRAATIGATVNISGSGVVNTGGRFLAGSGTATGVTVNHSGGVLNTVLDVRVADAGTPEATYNLSGAGIINSTTGGIVGRQGTGTFLQTGGVANFGGVFSIGNREGAANATTGLYKISGGDLNVATALNVAPKGTGELRVVGDDATIDLAGSFSVSNTVDGVGTLAYELEAGELLSVIDVIGTATFNSGASLVFDTTNAAPTQNVYDLLTAADIVDNGLSFSAPANWTYQIVAGGRGEILQAVLAVPEPSAIGMLLVAGATFVRRRR